MKKLQLSFEMPGPHLESLRKQFLDERHYDRPIVTEETCVLKPNGDILFILLRGALRLQLCSGRVLWAHRRECAQNDEIKCPLQQLD